MEKINLREIVFVVVIVALIFYINAQSPKAPVQTIAAPWACLVGLAPTYNYKGQQYDLSVITENIETGALQLELTKSSH